MRNKTYIKIRVQVNDTYLPVKEPVIQVWDGSEVTIRIPIKISLERGLDTDQTSQIEVVP